MPQNAGVAEPRLAAVDDGADALAGFFDRAFDRRAVARFARHRGRQRMAARQRQPRGQFKDVGIDLGRVVDAAARAA